MKPRILILLGTKAQLIKMAPIIQRLQKQNVPFSLLFTGQHRETITELRENYSLRNFDFSFYNGVDISRPTQFFRWFWLVWKSAQAQKSQFLRTQPQEQILLVHGDTFSTLLGVILGKLWHVKVGHIEAGLRSHHWMQPFPEEIIRVLVSQLADIAFCPGDWACQNINNRSLKINTQQNTLWDTVKQAMAHKPKFPLPTKPYGIVSLHRFETLYHQKQLRQALRIILFANRKTPLYFIAHPATQHRLTKLGWWQVLQRLPNVHLIPRLDSVNFLHFINQAEFVLTDGGSNQEECSYLGIPTLLLRHTTERQEGLGENVYLSQFDLGRTKKFLGHVTDYRRNPLTKKISPSEVIVDWLKENAA
jgi:UDP-N-acetylglucosamine 2-epimerase (non-hydrolysing)